MGRTFSIIVIVLFCDTLFARVFVPATVATGFKAAPANYKVQALPPAPAVPARATAGVKTANYTPQTLPPQSIKPQNTSPSVSAGAVNPWMGTYVQPQPVMGGGNVPVPNYGVNAGSSMGGIPPLPTLTNQNSTFADGLPAYIGPTMTALNLLPAIVGGSGSSGRGERSRDDEESKDEERQQEMLIWSNGDVTYEYVGTDSKWGKYNAQAPRWQSKWTANTSAAINTNPANLAGHDCTRPDKNAMTCMVCNAVFESCGQGKEGMKMVLGVTYTRARTKGFASTICGVVYQGQNTSVAQFSWTNDGKNHVLSSAQDKCVAIAKEAATEVLNSEPQPFTNFYANYVSPPWSRDGLCAKTLTQMVGNDPAHYHIFCQGTRDVNNISQRDWLQAENIQSGLSWTPVLSVAQTGEQPAAK